MHIQNLLWATFVYSNMCITHVIQLHIGVKFSCFIIYFFNIIPLKDICG